MSDDQIEDIRFCLAKVEILFTNYKKADNDLAKAKEALEAASVARSAAVKAILDQLGAGPWEVGGKQVKIVNKGGSYFFRGTRGAR